MNKELKFILWGLLICLILTFIIMPLRVKADSFGTYAVNTNVPLYFSCQNSTYLNISKVYLYPNGTNVISSETQTTKSGNVYNYTIKGANVSNIGNYVVYYHCDLNNQDTPSAGDFIVDNSGYSFSTSDSIILLLAFAIIGILILVFFTFGVKNENITIKIFCLSMATLFLVLLFGYGYYVFNQILGKYPVLASGMNNIYVLLVILLSAGGVGIVLWLIFYVLNLWWKYRGFRD